MSGSPCGSGVLSEENFLTDLNKVRCKTLIVHGESDTVIEPPILRHAQLKNPDDKRLYVSLEGCTHFPMLEAAPKFNRLILDFIHADNNLDEVAPKNLWKRRMR